MCEREREGQRQSGGKRVREKERGRQKENHHKKDPDSGAAVSSCNCPLFLFVVSYPFWLKHVIAVEGGDAEAVVLARGTDVERLHRD